jgi:D-alanyl-lipoteichoic acid acyltransferase DltB (MBOAT superfamily)
MYFNSYVYVLAFLPLVFFLYSITRTHVLSKWVIVVSSIIFYGWKEPWFVVPMLASGIVDYYLAQKIADSNDEAFRKRCLVTSLVFSLSLMAFFKYTGWVSESIVALGALAGIQLLASPVHVPLPPGVSFYTFETLSYTIDVYKREFAPKRRMLDYIAFLVFFPHLVAGPIRRAKQLLPILAEYRPAVSAEVASQAVFYVVWGLFLKVVCADNFGAIVENIDGQIARNKTLPAGAGLLFAYAFGFQIYCDFAAYSLIARGSALLFGVEINRNFLTPYFASNPSDFWQRWHISLSSWLRDYLYVPLGGNQHGRLKTLRNLLIVMLLGGLWHGAGLFFILWGLWHGLLLVLYRLVPIDAWLSRSLGGAGRALSVIVFFHLVCFGWILFRSNPDTVGAILNSIAAIRISQLNPFRIMSRFDPTLVFLAWTFVVYAVPVCIADWIGYRKNSEFPDLWGAMPALAKVALLVGVFYSMVFLGARQANEFIYFAF